MDVGENEITSNRKFGTQPNQQSYRKKYITYILANMYRSNNSEYKSRYDDARKLITYEFGNEQSLNIQTV